MSQDGRADDDPNSTGEAVTPVFDHLNFRQRREIGRLIERRCVDAGTTLMSEGERGDAFMFLFEGAAEAHTAAAGRVREIEAGGFFGELALLPHISGTEARTATVVATTNSCVGVCGQAEFDTIVERFPRVGGEILAQAYRLCI